MGLNEVLALILRSRGLPIRRIDRTTKQAILTEREDHEPVRRRHLPVVDWKPPWIQHGAWLHIRAEAICRCYKQLLQRKRKGTRILLELIDGLSP